MGNDVSQAAMAQFQKQGFIVLEDVLSARFVSQLRTAAHDRYAQLRLAVAMGDKKQASENFKHVVNLSFLTMKPDPEELYLNDRVLNHPRIARAISQVLKSDDFYIPIFDIAFNLQGKKSQHPHRDFATILPGEKPLPTTALCVAIPLVDTDEQNGSIRLWSGTHRLVDEQLAFHDSLKQQVTGRRHVQPKLKAGSVLLRDSRLIHCGMPNHTPTLRPWVAYMAIHPLIQFPNKLKMRAATFESLSARTRKRVRYSETR